MSSTFAVLRVALGHHAEKLGGRHQRPAGAAAPVEFRIVRLVREPRVIEEAGRRIHQAVRVLDHLPRRIVEILLVPGKITHLREKRNAHVQVVDPHRHRVRARARQRAVGHPLHLVRDEVGDEVDDRLEARDPWSACRS